MANRIRHVTNNTCDICGNRYHRRNLVEAWTSQNPGKRDGWTKEVNKVCTHCQSSKLSQRVFMAAQISVPRVVERHRKKG